ncbi:MAG: DNA mismatch repair endonuclease MutL [Bacteroidales bacterium]|nr:DNA mismatch repair endonuclease MutL [Clostridium sp.]MCM1204927.1 DNA mismatch repair endonuclease MutL [Bacteroidales bacterium]
MIKVLDQSTVNKIAAGEVVERPSSVVKELVENAIDAGATAVTIEIKEGGMSFIRITDNGQGIEKEEVPTAFIRHATSKIMTIEDLLGVSSLGFRGEALASIAAVSQVECITKTAHALTGIRYEIHGSKEIASEEIGAPTGTTIIVRNLFYNVPARKKFLKTAMTEGGYITELITRLSLSHPEVSFKYIINGSNKIATSGNGKLQDVIYHIYGKDVSNNLLPVKRSADGFAVEGYIGKAYVSKGNRSFEHYFVNGRYIRNTIVTKAIEEAYKSFVMIHKFPFTALHFTLDSNKLDVNVHPTKMEFKYADGEQLFAFVKDSVRQALLQEEMIQDVSLKTAKEERTITIEQQRKSTLHVPEPFEQQARAMRYQQAAVSEKAAVRREIPKKEETVSQAPAKPSSDEQNKTLKPVSPPAAQEKRLTDAPESKIPVSKIPESEMPVSKIPAAEIPASPDVQLSFPVERFISKEARKRHRLIGQVFKTYWLIEYDEKLYVVDQHAAHEKVMFERLMKQQEEKNVISQQVLPPKVLHLDSIEYETVLQYRELFVQTGFDFEDFGDDSIVIRAMPDDIMGVDSQYLFDALLNALKEGAGKISLDFFVEKLSGMACKAAIKGNTEITTMEAERLIEEMLTLDNPYNCPHGRPTMIALTKSELERKFKRIQN